MRAAAEARGSLRRRQAQALYAQHACVTSASSCWRLQDFEEGEVIFTERPLVAAQDRANKAVAFVCSHCFCYLGSVEAQIARRLLPGGDAAGDSRSPARIKG